MRFALALLVAPSALAHVGSPDVFHETQAGPYRLMVTIRPPQVVPGVAEIEIRSATPEMREIQVAPVPLTGPGAKLPPTPDILERSKADPQFYTGSVWLMACCHWQVRIHADGAQGRAETSVPVTGVASRVLRMEKTMAGILLFFLVFLAAGAISIVGVYVREGRLDPGREPGSGELLRGRIAMAAGAGVIAASIWLGKLWWDAEDNAFQRFLYKPLNMMASYEAGRLDLALESSGWLQKLDDLVPDHNHLMHAYVVRTPEMDRVWHLHPEMGEPGRFYHHLPPMPAGRYQIWADIVHKTGLPETLTAEIELPEVMGNPLAGDDSSGSGPPLGAGFGRAHRGRVIRRLPHGLGARPPSAAGEAAGLVPLPRGGLERHSRPRPGILHGDAGPRGVRARRSVDLRPRASTAPCPWPPWRSHSL